MGCRIVSTERVAIDITPAWWRGQRRTFERAARCATKMAEIHARPSTDDPRSARFLLGQTCAVATDVSKPFFRLHIIRMIDQGDDDLEAARMALVAELDAIGPERAELSPATFAGIPFPATSVVL